MFYLRIYSSLLNQISIFRTMKFISKIVLLIFVLFLATPTIVAAIDERC